MRLLLRRTIRFGLLVSVLSALMIILQMPAIAAAQQEQEEEQVQEIESYILTVEIDAPPDFVYPYLIYEDKIQRWNKDDSVVVEYPKGLEPRVGKQILVTLKVFTNPSMLMEITELDQDREVVTEFIDGVLTGIFSYRLEPIDEDTTLLVHEMAIKPVGAFITLIWKIHGEKMHREKMEMYLGRIKDLVEGDWKLESATVEPKAGDIESVESGPENDGAPVEPEEADAESEPGNDVR